MNHGPWLVTGASGFLGRHLLEAVAAGAHPLPTIALVRDAAAWHSMEWTGALPRVRILEGSVLEPETWTGDPGLDGLAGIFHLAALVGHSPDDAAQVLRTNVEGTLNLVRLAAARRCRMVFVSTSGTVGCFSTAGRTADEDAPYCEAIVSRWPYYRSKIAAEQQARRLAAELGVDLVIMRPPVLLGPGDHRFRSSAHVLRILRGKVPFLIRGGMHFADVRDVAQALICAMQLPRVRPVYHLPGTVSTLAEFYRQVAELAKIRAPRLTVPFRPAWLLASLSRRLGLSALPEPALIEMASRHWAVDSRYAREELGYESRPPQDTLADTISWLRANHREPW